MRAERHLGLSDDVQSRSATVGLTTATHRDRRGSLTAADTGRWDGTEYDRCMYDVGTESDAWAVTQ